MKAIFVLALIFLSFGIVRAQKKIESVFPLQWKSKVGTSTYRNNVVFQEGYLFIGSSGKDLNLDIDPLDGVHILNAKTGKLFRHIAPPQLGDNDVNGIAVSGDFLYFGSDNDYFYCYNWKNGQEKWKFPTVNDCESVPALSDFNGDGSLDVVFNVQMDGVYVLDGKTGKVIWENDSLGTHQGNSSPALYDVNKDGLQDVIATGRPDNKKLSERWKEFEWNDVIYCLDGKSGAVLWVKPMEAGIHASPVLVKPFGYDDALIYIRSVSDVRAYNVLDGRLAIDMGYYGSFGGMLIGEDGKVFFGNEYAYQSEEKVYCVDMSCDLGQINCGYYWSDGGGVQYPKEESYGKYEIQGAVSASPVMANVLTFNKKKTLYIQAKEEDVLEVLIPSEKGELLILDEEGKELMKLKLPSGSEATLFIEDVDGDGKLEIIQLGLDGMVYCYTTNSTSQPYWGTFRGKNNGGFFTVE